MDYDLFARYFELFSGQAADDLPAYLGWARQIGGPVLELGCGTGRVALALAEEGLDVTGIDRSPAMLNIARQKLHRAGLDTRVRWIQADLDVHLGQHFRLAVCAQNTFCHLLSTADQLRALNAARRQLVDGGRLILDVFNPDPLVLTNADRRLVLMAVKTDPTTGHTLVQSLAREIDPGEQIEHQTMFIDELDDGRLVGRHVFEFDLRYFYRFELELLLDKAGFQLQALYGSYELDAFNANSERLLAVAKR